MNYKVVMSECNFKCWQLYMNASGEYGEDVDFIWLKIKLKTIEITREGKKWQWGWGNGGRPFDPVSGRDAHATTMHCVLIWRSNMCNLHRLLVIHKYRSAFSTIFVHLCPSFNTSNCSSFTINEWLVELGRRLGILRAMGSLPSNILGHKNSIFHFHFSRFPRTILTLNSQNIYFTFPFLAIASSPSLLLLSATALASLWSW